MSEIVFLYCTAPDEATAGSLARTLIAERLAACVNIHASMRSVYRWEGAVEDGAETPMIVKTSAAKADAARDRILEDHPYDCPCVVAIDIRKAGSHAPFLEWIEAATNA